MPGSGQNRFACSKSSQADRVRELNDAFRHQLIGGRVMLTSGVAALGPLAVSGVLYRLRNFDGFERDNDAYGEHDFGALIYAGERFLWKIDYYADDLNTGSPDPADPALTIRVLTVMLASEY